MIATGLLQVLSATPSGASAPVGQSTLVEPGSAVVGRTFDDALARAAALSAGAQAPANDASVQGAADTGAEASGTTSPTPEIPVDANAGGGALPPAGQQSPLDLMPSADLPIGPPATLEQPIKSTAPSQAKKPPAPSANAVVGAIAVAVVTPPTDSVAPPAEPSGPPSPAPVADALSVAAPPTTASDEALDAVPSERVASPSVAGDADATVTEPTPAQAAALAEQPVQNDVSARPVAPSSAATSSGAQDAARSNGPAPRSDAQAVATAIESNPQSANGEPSISASVEPSARSSDPQFLIANAAPPPPADALDATVAVLRRVAGLAVRRSVDVRNDGVQGDASAAAPRVAPSPIRHDAVMTPALQPIADPLTDAATAAIAAAETAPTAGDPSVSGASRSRASDHPASADAADADATTALFDNKPAADPASAARNRLATSMPAAPRFAEQLAMHAARLRSTGLNRISIALEPAELGRLEIHIKVQSDTTHVSFVAQHAAVRDALVTELPRLRGLLESSGLSLGDVNVGGSRDQQRDPTDTRPVVAAGASGNDASREPAIARARDGALVDVHA